jgi:chromosomal replication initiation ATPase DnaA
MEGFLKAFREARGNKRVLGGSEFVQSVLKEIEGQKDKTKPMGKVSEGALQRLMEAVASRLELSNAEVAGGSRRRHIVEARNLISHLAVRGYGMPLTKVAAVLKISKQSVLRGLEKGEQMLRDRGWEAADLIK